MSLPALLKAKIKGHYRRLPNGRTIFIREHRDKRKEARADPKKYRHRVVHSDENSTTLMGHRGELKTYPHAPWNELDEEAIHRHLNSAVPIDEHLAERMWMQKHGIRDMNEFLDRLVEDEQLRPSPRFSDRKGAHDFILKVKERKGDRDSLQGIREYQAELKRKFGSVTTHASAYRHEHDDYRRYIDEIAQDPGAPEHERSEAQMTREYSEDAIQQARHDVELVKRANKMLPKDCPDIPGLDQDTTFFGHQAETVAKLGVLPRAIVDVDMGGGKGLILPADALNLMGQGKVKRPLVVVPGATLDQNASKTIEYTKGRINVFKISNAIIRDEFDGDIEKVVEAIQKAPPNTIFMADYSVFPYDTSEKGSGRPEFGRAEALGAGVFDLVSLDESHRMKNPDTALWKSMRHLSNAKYKRAASGSFLSNNPRDVLGQLQFLYPSVQLSQEEFDRRYGRTENEEGVQWTRLKQLRQDLKDIGMISLRRSAWIDKLPERREELAITQMEPHQAKVYEAVLEDVLQGVEDEIARNPKLKRLLLEDGIDDVDELPPSVLAKLNVIGGITDYPHELALMMEERLERVAEAKRSGQIDAETEQLIESLQSMGKSTRLALASLKGVVSPKAKDLYQKLDAHFADKKNGKYIVFVQRKASARHILENMPRHHRDRSVYYEAGMKQALDSFNQDPKGPQIIVAVDASIKEGVNMQIANGMYRYDHHFSPGSQEQSYARIWRFGQDKPVTIHMGIADNSMDVTKYARLMTKLHQNMQVTSDFEGESPPAYRLGIENIRHNRKADSLRIPTATGTSQEATLQDYAKLSDEILRFQKQENRHLAKRYKQMVPRGTGKAIGGKDARQMHGIGPYQSDLEVAKAKPLEAREKDQLLGHFRDVHRRNRKHAAIFDTDTQDHYFPDVLTLALRHKSRGGGKEVDPHTIEQYVHEYREVNGPDSLSDREVKLWRDTLEAWASGKPHTPHPKVERDIAVRVASESVGLETRDKSALRSRLKHVDGLLQHLGGKRLVLLEGGKVENPEVAAAYWKELARQHGSPPPARYRRAILAAAAMIQEVSGGWHAIRDQYEHLEPEGNEEE